MMPAGALDSPSGESWANVGWYVISNNKHGSNQVIAFELMIEQPERMTETRSRRPEFEQSAADEARFVKQPIWFNRGIANPFVTTCPEPARHIGWLDNRESVPARWRTHFHLACSNSLRSYYLL